MINFTLFVVGLYTELRIVKMIVCFYIQVSILWDETSSGGKDQYPGLLVIDHKHQFEWKEERSHSSFITFPGEVVLHSHLYGSLLLL